MAQFLHPFSSPIVPCPPEGWYQEFMRMLNSEYPNILKRSNILYQHQRRSGQGTAHFYTSFEEWFVENIFNSLRSIRIREVMELQSLPKPCSRSCPCCADHIQMFRTRVATLVHEELSQLLNNPVSSSDYLKSALKKAFKDAWRRYFGELKELKADNLEGFSLAKALSTVLENAKVKIESQGVSALRTSALSQIDDADAVMYD